MAGGVSQPTYALTGSLWVINSKISVTWGAAPSPCNTPEKSLEKGGGTYVTCPICQAQMGEDWRGIPEMG